MTRVKLLNQTNSKLKEKNFTSACGATTAASGEFSSATAAATAGGGGASGTSAGKTTTGAGGGGRVVHRPSWSKRRKNQDSALAAKLDKFAFTRVYLNTERYSQKGIIKYTPELTL